MWEFIQVPNSGHPLPPHWRCGHGDADPGTPRQEVDRRGLNDVEDTYKAKEQQRQGGV